MVQTYPNTEAGVITGHDSNADAQVAEEYARVLDVVQHLPIPLLTDLLHQIANRIGEQATSIQVKETASVITDDPKHNSLKLLLGRMKTSRPAPTDEEVAQWLNERRMERYG